MHDYSRWTTDALVDELNRVPDMAGTQHFKASIEKAVKAVLDKRGSVPTRPFVRENRSFRPILTEFGPGLDVYRKGQRSYPLARIRRSADRRHYLINTTMGPTYVAGTIDDAVERVLKLINKPDPLAVNNSATINPFQY